MVEQLREQVKIAFCGGGTGGHVYPALAVIEALPDSVRDTVYWIGSRGGMEEDVLAGAGIPFFGVPSGKLRRYFSLKNVTDPLRVIAGFFAARRVLKANGASVLFSKGGFVAVPVVWAARSLGIPVAIHESDPSPGLATRITARSADTVFVPYPESATRFPEQFRDRIVAAGNPIRRSLLAGDPESALKWFDLEDPGDPVVLVLGGSLGARQINELLWSCIPAVADEAIVVHQTGAGNVPPEEIRTTIRKNRYIVREYFSAELPDLYARADLVVARAGAGLVWEIAVNRKPALLIPLSGRVSRGDQLLNAELLASAGAATVLDPDTVDSGVFREEVLALLRDRERREKMANSGRERYGSTAAVTIADHLVLMIDGGRNGTERV